MRCNLNRIHARDRRRWFAANFGRGYFRSQPLGINPLGAALGLGILACALLVLAVMAMDGHQAGYALAISPLLTQAREKAARCLNRAQEIQKKYKPEDQWSAEDSTNFEAAMKDFGTANNEVTVLQAREEQQEILARETQRYLQPQNNVQALPVTGQAVNVREAFSRYLRGDKTLPEAARKECMTIHREAMMAYFRGDREGLQAYLYELQKTHGPTEVHALLSNDNTLGGFTVPDDWRAEVLKAEAGYAVLAPLCRVEPTNRDALVFPKLKPHASDSRRTSGFAGKFQQQGYVTGGTAPTVQNYPTFQQERIPVHSWQPDAVEVSPELLDDSGANLEAIIAEAIGECLGFDKDDKILEGTGVNEPEGLLNAGITTVNSGGATSIAIGGIIGMFSEVPAQYRQRATWVMASRTMGAVLQLNTGTGGVYLFPPNQWNNTILGRPVVFLDYGMDTATAAGGTTFTASEYPIIFGDFRNYIIAQRAALRIQRLIERFAPNIGFLPTARLGGQVVLTDAFRIMTVAA